MKNKPFTFLLQIPKCKCAENQSAFMRVYNNRSQVNYSLWVKLMLSEGKRLAEATEQLKPCRICSKLEPDIEPYLTSSDTDYLCRDCMSMCFNPDGEGCDPETDGLVLCADCETVIGAHDALLWESSDDERYLCPSCHEDRSSDAVQADIDADNYNYRRY